MTYESHFPEPIISAIYEKASKLNFLEEWKIIKKKYYYYDLH